ncbi:hypothetical protein SRIMM317S_01682 [Streptomyces rimosus subsp. rimosus]
MTSLVSNNVDEMGGVTTWSHQMARLFAERGHRVHVIGVVPAPEELRADLGADLPYKTTTLYDEHPPKAVPAARGIKGRLNIAEQRRRAARQAGMEEQAAKLSACPGRAARAAWSSSRRCGPWSGWRSRTPRGCRWSA